MIFGSIESDQIETMEYLEEKHGGSTNGVNMVEVARALYNEGRPGVFELVGLQMPLEAEFRFAPDAPWSHIPSTGFLNFTAISGAKAIITYLEIANAETFNIYFGMN